MGDVDIGESDTAGKVFPRWRFAGGSSFRKPAQPIWAAVWLPLGVEAKAGERGSDSSPNSPAVSRVSKSPEAVAESVRGPDVTPFAGGERRDVSAADPDRRHGALATGRSVGSARLLGPPRLAWLLGLGVRQHVNHGSLASAH